MAEAAGCRVTVLGGSGFVGSRVCKLLVQEGAAVTSVSRSGKPPAWAAGEDWVKRVDWVANDLTKGAREDLEAAIGKPVAVVSCVGAVGFDGASLLNGNGKTNIEAARAVKKAGTAKRYAFVSVSSELARLDGTFWLPSWLSCYFKGKASAEAAMVDAVGADGVTVVKPTFIYGGSSFGLSPPRVAGGYGSAVEEVLSNGILSKIADIAPGTIKIALRPPVSADAVAGACARAALGKLDERLLDTTAKINQAAGVPPATGLTDFVAAVSAKFSELVNKVKAAV
jgi:nucleoside-diphosphate-sugar epimerase